ncbi:SIR2 family protein [Lactococcus lactis]|uniref:SIR2 family protein n=1 Tax=Lactococcus lactis TaxID=1358 RepID=UPI00398280BD
MKGKYFSGIDTENESTLLKDLTGKINLFTGAGFSVLATNSDGEGLPLGSELGNLISNFCKERGDNYSLDLQRIYAIANLRYKEELKDFLNDLFTVHSFDQAYENINLLNIRNWFTTNIDDLPYHAINDERYLNNIYNSGDSFSTNEKAINFFPFHGNVREKNSREYVFSETELAGSIASSSGARRTFNTELLKYPTFFIGYSFRDLVAWKEINEIQHSQKNMWILLTPEDKDATAFFTDLGFQVIIGDVKNFLQAIGKNIKKSEKQEDFSEEFKEYSFPKLEKKDPFTDIKNFYQGNEPYLNQISKIPRLSSFQKLENKVYGDRNIIVTGMIFSGKTTMAKQLFKQLSDDNRDVYYFDKPLSTTETNFLLSKLDTVQKEHRLVFIIDDFCSNVDFVLGILRTKKVQVIAFDRFYNYDSLRHRFIDKNIDYLEVSDLNNQDIGQIINNMPESIRKNNHRHNRVSEFKTIFDVVERNLRNDEKISTRVSKMLQVIKNNKNENLLDLLLLTAYFSKAKVSLSMNTLICFFDMNYKNIYDLIRTLQDQIVEDVFDESADQDYFKLRSSVYGSKIIELSDKHRLKEVMKKLAYEVPTEYIESYYIFKKYAYDSDLVFKVFDNIDEGLDFYRVIYQKDKNPYTYQHAAMYAAKMNNFTEAFTFINEAISSTSKRIFSIQNVYANILFQANFEQDFTSPRVVAELDKSMSILESCINDAQGKVYHIVSYSKQAIKLYQKLHREKDREYSEKALRYIDEVMPTLDENEKKNKRDLKYQKDMLEKVIKGR